MVLGRDFSHESPQPQSINKLDQFIGQLTSKEKNNLRNRWGSSIEELICLSKETDSTIFYHGLLEIGRRLEDSEEFELAELVYGEIAKSKHAVPPDADIIAIAQSRINAINGRGDWRTRLIFNLERLPSNVSRWDAIFAMTGAGLLFSGTRIAIAARYAKNFQSATALNVVATSTAFLTETTAYLGLSRLAGSVVGHRYDWSMEGMHNEWVSGMAMLFGLKVMGGVFGKLSGHWGAGESVFAKATRVIAPEVAMLGGILVGNRLAELGGFHKTRYGDTWLIDGMSSLLEFKIAQRLQQKTFGPNFLNVESRMQFYSKTVPVYLKEGLPPKLAMATGIWDSGIKVTLPKTTNHQISNFAFSVRSDLGESGNPHQGKDGLRPFAFHDYERVHQLFAKSIKNWNSSVEEMKYRDQNLDKKCAFGRWVVQIDGQIIAVGEFSQPPQMYHPRKFSILLAVDPRLEGQGIGTLLYHKLLHELQGHRPISLRVELSEESVSGLRFFEKRGFKTDKKFLEMSLNPSQVSMAALHEWKSLAIKNGIEIKALSELKDSPDRDRKLFELMAELMKDQPRADPYTPLTFQSFTQLILNNPNRPHSGFFVAIKDGHYIGTSSFLFQENGHITNKLTGVLQTHRRMGVALALKAFGIEYAKDLEIKRINTINISGNEGMIRTNRKIGYQTTQTLVSLVKNLADE